MANSGVLATNLLSWKDTNPCQCIADGSKKAIVFYANVSVNIWLKLLLTMFPTTFAGYLYPIHSI
jgi:hypothetical protein